MFIKKLLTIVTFLITICSHILIRSNAPSDIHREERNIIKVSRGETKQIPRREDIIRINTIAAINDTVKGVFKDKGEIIYDISKKYNISAKLLTAIMLHETGNGTSNLCVNYNNPGGLFDGKYNRFMRFKTLKDGIIATANFIEKFCINKGKTSIEEIGSIYCPIGESNDINGLNNDWIPTVTIIYNRITNKVEELNSKIIDLNK